MLLTSRRSSGLEHVIFLQCSDIAIALAGPMPERAEAISSTEAELTLTGLADTEKLKIDKTKPLNLLKDKNNINITQETN